MAERRRRVAPSSLIAAADIMACFIGILFVVLVESKAKVETEVEALEAKKVALQAEVVRQEAEQAEALRRQEKERAEKEREIEKKIAAAEARLEQKQQNFQNWDWVVNRLRVSRGMSRVPDTHLYLRLRGIYRDGSERPMTDEQVLAFLLAESEDAVNRPGGKALIAAWQENGTNDQYIRVLDMKDRISGLDEQIVIHTIILPSGVRAGPEQKGSERIDKGGAP